eukprot:scaffold88617_cov63-Attheya_sp.AAC.5
MQSRSNFPEKEEQALSSMVAFVNRFDGSLVHRFVPMHFSDSDNDDTIDDVIDNSIDDTIENNINNAINNNGPGSLVIDLEFSPAFHRKMVALVSRICTPPCQQRVIMHI